MTVIDLQMDNKELRSQLSMKDEQLLALTKQVSELQDKLEHLAERAIDAAKPTQNQTINNNYIHLEPLILAPDFVNEQVQKHFDRSYFYLGQKGVARFAADKLLKDRNGGFLIECSDPSRQVYRFKDENGEIIRDLQAKHLTSIIAEPISLKTEEILDRIEDTDPLYPREMAHKIAYEIYQLKRDNNENMCRELRILLAK
jgi:hypothetical protein